MFGLEKAVVLAGTFGGNCTASTQSKYKAIEAENKAQRVSRHSGDYTKANSHRQVKMEGSRSWSVSILDPKLGEGGSHKTAQLQPPIEMYY